jgi:hypothetical protein
MSARSAAILAPRQRACGITAAPPASSVSHACWCQRSALPWASQLEGAAVVCASAGLILRRQVECVTVPTADRALLQ